MLPLTTTAGAHRWRSTTKVAVGQLVAWGTLYYGYAALAPSITAATGLSATVIAGAFSASLLLSGSLAPAIGRELDRAGARPVLLAGAIVGPLALLALASASTLTSVWLAFLALGVAQALSLYEPAFRAVVSWFPRDRERRVALLVVTSVGGLASTIFVPLAVWLVAELGWRSATVLLSALLALVAIPVALRLPSSGVAEVADAAAERVTDSMASHAVVSPVAIPLEARSAREALPGIRGLSVAFGMQSFASAAVTVSLLGHLVAGGASELHAALLLGLVGAAQIPGRLVITPLQAFVPDRWRLPLGFAGQAVALTVMAFGAGPSVLMAALLFGALAGAMTMERAVVTARRYGDAHFGRASGRIASSALAGRALAPVTVEFARALVGYAEVLGGVAVLLAAAGLVIPGAASAVPRSTSSNSGRSSANPLGRGGSSIASTTSSIVRTQRKLTAARTSAGISRRSFSLAAGSTTDRNPAR